MPAFPATKFHEFLLLGIDLIIFLQTKKVMKKKIKPTPTNNMVSANCPTSNRKISFSFFFATHQNVWQLMILGSRMPSHYAQNVLETMFFIRLQTDRTDRWFSCFKRYINLEDVFFCLFWFLYCRLQSKMMWTSELKWLTVISFTDIYEIEWKTLKLMEWFIKNVVC